MFRPIFPETVSADRDFFHVERSSAARSSPRQNIPDTPNSMQLSRALTGTVGSDSNERTMLYGYGRLQPTVLLSLNDLNLPKSSFNVTTFISPAPTTMMQPYDPTTNNNPEQTA